MEKSKKRKITKIIDNIEEDLKDIMRAADIINVRAPLIYAKVEAIKKQNEKTRKNDTR